MCVALLSPVSGRTLDARYRAMFEQAAVGIIEADLDSVISDVNQKFCDLVGRTREQIIGKCTWDITHPDDAGASHAMPAALLGGEQIPPIQKRYLHRDGRVVPVELCISVVRDESGAPERFLGIVQDIGERLRASQALGESEQRYRELVESSANIIWSVDKAGNIAFVSEAARRVFGESPADMQGRPFRDYVVPADLPIVAEKVQAMFQGAVVADCEFTARRHDGGIVRLRFNGRPALGPAGEIRGAFGTAADITEERAAKERAKENQRRLEIALSVVDMGMFAQDLDLRYTWLYYAKSEERPNQVVGLTDFDLADEQEAAQAVAIKRRALETGAPARGEVRVTRPGQKARDWELIVEPQRDALGRVCGVIGACIDITERKRLEQQLRQSQKMEAIGLLTGGVAHDFNNMLAVILSYCTLLHDAVPEALREDLSQIRAAGEAAANLTRQLLAFSRRQVLQPQLIDLNVVVAGTEKLLRRLIREDVELDVAPSAEPVMAHVDPGQIEQVVMNLAVNARDAMPGGGRLRIAIENAEGGPALTVSDTGCGMDEAVQARIFEPFFTTKEVGKGTGLGLSTVLGIVQQSGGTIDVESRAGAGSSFRIRLPRVSSSALAPRQNRPADSPALRGSETVLLVEDDAMVRKLAATILERNGYRVLQALTAGDALLLAEQKGKSIQLVLTDMVMPQLSGTQLAERLRSIIPGVPVVYMSGYMTRSAPEVLPESAMFVQKPFTPETLLHKLREALGAASRVAAGRRVLVIDDEPVMLRLMARALDDYDVVALDDGREALARMRAGERFGAILCDVFMPHLTGPQFLKELDRIDPQSANRVFFLTGATMGNGGDDFAARYPGRILTKPVQVGQVRQVVSALMAGLAQ